MGGALGAATLTSVFFDAARADYAARLAPTGLSVDRIREVTRAWRQAVRESASTGAKILPEGMERLFEDAFREAFTVGVARVFAVGALVALLCAVLAAVGLRPRSGLPLKAVLHEDCHCPAAPPGRVPVGLAADRGGPRQGPGSPGADTDAGGTADHDPGGPAHPPAYNNEGSPSSDTASPMSVGEPWILLEVASRFGAGSRTTADREALSLETPDGKTQPPR